MKRTIPAKPYFYYLLLSAIVLITTIPGLGVLEFFRHTEADRALIAEEMLDTGDYIVPQLLGQPILTKPPIYYWLSASIFKVMGDRGEFEARLPSVFAATFLALIHFSACRYAGFSLSYGFGSTLVLISTLSFFTLSVLAEIDMLYAAFCAAGLYLLYFAIARVSFSLTLLSYFFVALAFLTKGPPIIAFYAMASLGFYFTRRKQFSLKKYFVFNLIGVVLFISILSLWLVPLVREIDFSILKQQFNREILGRAIGQPRKARSIFFYFGSVLGSCLPWTLPCLVACFCQRINWREKINQHKSFLQFCALVFCSGFLILSLAKGKSSRYLFSMHTFAVQILFFALLQTKDFWLRFYSPKKGGARQIQYAFSILVLCVLSVRLVQGAVYSPYRNSKFSVKPVVESIHKIVGTEPVYTAEMYERWIMYYLKKSLVPIAQLQGLRSITPTSPKIFWLITDKDESDLLELLKADSSSVLLSRFSLPSTNMFLYQSDTQKALEIINQIKLTRKERETY